MGEEARDAVERHPEAAGDILGPSYPVEGLKAQQSQLPRIWLMSCKSGLFRRSLCARQATGSLHETRHARNNVGQCATEGMEGGRSREIFDGVVFYWKPCATTYWICRKGNSSKARARARARYRERQRERARKRASERQEDAPAVRRARGPAGEAQHGPDSWKKESLCSSRKRKGRKFFKEIFYRAVRGGS